MFKKSVLFHHFCWRITESPKQSMLEARAMSVDLGLDTPPPAQSHHRQLKARVIEQDGQKTLLIFSLTKCVRRHRIYSINIWIWYYSTHQSVALKFPKRSGESTPSTWKNRRKRLQSRSREPADGHKKLGPYFWPTLGQSLNKNLEMDFQICVFLFPNLQTVQRSNIKWFVDFLDFNESRSKAWTFLRLPGAGLEACRAGWWCGEAGWGYRGVGKQNRESRVLSMPDMSKPRNLRMTSKRSYFLQPQWTHLF